MFNQKPLWRAELCNQQVPVVLVPYMYGFMADFRRNFDDTGCETGNLNQSPEFRVELENWRLSSPSEITVHVVCVSI